MKIREVHWLVIAALLQLFVGGKWNVWIAPWFSYLFFMRFARSQHSYGLVWIGVIPFSMSTGFSMYGFIPLPIPVFFLFIIMMSVLIYSGFIIDRWASRKSKGLVSALLFPSFLVTLEGIVSLGPYGTWNSLAYSQAENGVLIQLVSVTGIWGITFLIGLFVSLFNAFWSDGFSAGSMRKYILPLAIVFTVIFSFGMLRFKLWKSPTTVKVGMCSVEMPQGNTLKDIVIGYVLNETPVSDTAKYKAGFNVVQDSLIQMTLTLAKAGAKIIVWSEANAIVFAEDEPRMARELSRISKQYDAYVFAAMAVLTFGEKQILNKVSGFSPQGKLVMSYTKSIIPPGEPSVRGEGVLRYIDTPYGRVSTAICFDMDFPNLISQAGANQTDILLVPALDWKEIDYTHAQMARFRGIEQGVSVVRNAYDGMSIISNPMGRINFSLGFFDSQSKGLLDEVPVTRIETLYSKLGNCFLYCCMLILCLSIVWSVRKTYQHG